MSSIENIAEILWGFRYVIIFIIAVAVYALLEWNSFKGKIYAMMLQAKRLAKDAILSSGEEQVAWVVQKAYQYLPAYIMAFLSEERLRSIILYLYDQAKDYIDDGEFNNSI
ncbi:MAG: hypothetical protein ACOWWR_15575 [Eubacteriales bacterium]